jgi:hypothetical protein
MQLVESFSKIQVTKMVVFSDSMIALDNTKTMFKITIFEIITIFKVMSFEEQINPLLKKYISGIVSQQIIIESYNII